MLVVRDRFAQVGLCVVVLTRHEHDQRDQVVPHLIRGRGEQEKVRQVRLGLQHVKNARR